MKIYNVSEPIVNHYITLINAGKKTIEDVPAKFQKEIASLLNIPLSTITLEDAIKEKEEELNIACQTCIYQGTDILLSDGNIHHFSFTLEDQSNLKNCLDIAVASKSAVLYHADNESFVLYSLEDLVTIYSEEQSFIMTQTAFVNTLKKQVNELTTIEDVLSVTYNTKLLEHYQEEYCKIVSCAKELKETIRATYIE